MSQLRLACWSVYGSAWPFASACWSAWVGAVRLACWSMSQLRLACWLVYWWAWPFASAWACWCAWACGSMSQLRLGCVAVGVWVGVAVRVGVGVRLVRVGVLVDGVVAWV